MNGQTPITGSRAVVGCANAAATAADLQGHAASFALALLTLGIILGIVLRWAGIDNSWTYDFDLFTLVWSAFSGAAYTSLRGRHVTAGIAIENVIGRGTLLSILRLIIIVGFLILLTISGVWDTFSSWQTSETTVDVEQWPVWIAKAALPVGVAFWAIAEFAKFLGSLAGVPLREDEIMDE